jgi:hypothetical protein
MLCARVPCVSAATYVVAPSGSDSNTGTLALPFQTIAKAAGAAHAGDTVIVKAGVYREAVHLRNSGTTGAPIKFVADPPGSVLVSGADVETDWQRASGDAPIYEINWDHVFAIDWNAGKPIEFHPDDAPLWGRAEQVIADSKQLLPAPDIETLAKDWAALSAEVQAGKSPAVAPPVHGLGGPFVGYFFADTVNKHLYVLLADGSDPNKHQMEAATRAQTFGVNPWENKEGVQNVQVSGFHFRYGASFPQRAAVWLHGAHNEMDHCLIEDMAGSGVGVDGVMRNCVVRDCGQTGGCGNGPGFLNENCLWEGNCWKPINRGWDAGGVKIAVVNGGQFDRCVFVHNGGPGLWFDIDVHNVHVTHCVFDENEGSGLFIEISRNNTVDHNLSVGNAVGAVGSGGNWSDGGIVLAESEHCTVTNNTCVGNKDGITFREQGPRPLDTSDGKIPFHDTGDVIGHNVSAFNQGYQLGMWYDNGFFGRHPAEVQKYPTEDAYSQYLLTIPDKVFDPTKAGHTIDDNVYFETGNKPLVLYGVPWRIRHREFATLADFTAFTGFDAHSRVVDPQIKSVTTGDFRLNRSSPARRSNAGWSDPPANIVPSPSSLLGWQS